MNATHASQLQEHQQQLDAALTQARAALALAQNIRSTMESFARTQASAMPWRSARHFRFNDYTV